MKHISKNTRGFTLIELMIATSVFAVILLLITSGMLEVGRLFYKGVNSSNTQEITRVILEDVSQAIQFSGESVNLPSASRPTRFCVGSRRYTFNTGAMYIVGANHVLIVDRTSSTCNDQTDPADLGNPEAPTPVRNNMVPPRELMGRNMRLANIEVRCANNGPPSCPNGTYDIKVRVAYGDDDLLEDANGPNARCRQDIRAGTQFCSVSELETTVTRRVE